MGYGTIIGNLIPFIIQPFLTRTISAESLGNYSLVISKSNLVVPVSSLMLYQLIVNANTDKDAENIGQTSINTVILVTINYTVIIFISLILNIGTFHNLGLISLYIPIIVLIDGIYYVVNSYFNRYKIYSKMAKNEVQNGSIRGLLQVLLASLKFGALGQILSHFISPFR